MGVNAIARKRSLLGAMFVSRILVSPSTIRQDKSVLHTPITAGASALIRIFSLSSRLARDRTSPITPCLAVEYTGAMGKGYRPALEAVQMMQPLEADGEGVFLAI